MHRRESGLEATGHGEAADEQVVAGGREPFAEADQRSRAVDEALGVAAPEALGESPPRPERARRRQRRRRRSAPGASASAAASALGSEPAPIEPSTIRAPAQSSERAPTASGAALALEPARRVERRPTVGRASSATANGAARGPGPVQGHEVPVAADEIDRALEDGVHAADDGGGRGDGAAVSPSFDAATTRVAQAAE